MEDSVQSKILKSAIYDYLGSFTNAILLFLILIYLLRNLSVEQFGQYNVILSTIIFFVLFLNFGIPTLILRFLPEYIVKGNFKIAKKFISNGLLLVLGAGVFTVVISYFIDKFHNDLLNKFALAQFLFIAAIIGFLRVQIRILKAVFSSFFQKGFQNLFEVFSSFLKLCLIIFALRMGYGLIGVFTSIGIAELILIVAYIIKVSGYFKDKENRGYEISKKRLFKFGFKEYIAKLLSFFWDSRIDAYVITFFLGTYATGVFYFVISIVMMLVQYMPGTIMVPIAHALYARQYAKSNNKKELNYLFQLNNKAKTFFIFPAFLGFIILVDKIVPFIFGSKYEESLVLFPIILFFMVFYLLAIPVRSIINALEKNEITIISGLVILYKIPALILLTKKFGLYGAAFALGTSVTIYFFISLVLTKRHIELQYPWMAFSKIFLNSIIMGIAVYFMKGYVHNLSTLILVIIVGIVIYLITGYMNKAFSENDRKLINQPFKRLVFNF